MTQSTADIKPANFDPYYLDPRDVMEPPTEFGKIIKNRPRYRVIRVDRRIR